MQPRPVAAQGERFGQVVDDEGDLPGRGLVLNHGRRAGEKAVQIEGGFFQFEFAGVDFRQVEDGIDGFQQMLAGRVDLVEAFFLLAVDPGTAQQVHHAADRVERRAYFVRHVGDERTLGLVGSLRHLAPDTGAQPDDAEADVGGKFFQQLDFVGAKGVGLRGIDAQGAKHRFAVLQG